MEEMAAKKSYEQNKNEIEARINKMLGFNLMRILMPAGYVCFVVLLVMLVVFWNDDAYRSGMVNLFAFLFFIYMVGSMTNYLGKILDKRNC